MKLGLIIDGHAGFISELREDWERRFSTEIFAFQDVHFPVAETRINRRRLDRSLKRFLGRNDRIFFEWSGNLLILASRMQPSVPLITRLHSWELYQFADRVCWDSVSRVILVSEAMRRRFVELFPACADKAQVVYCGKSLERFKPRPQLFQGNIGMLCDLVPIKRVYEAILLLYDLDRQGLRLRLHLGGQGRDGSENLRYHASLQRAVEKLGLQDRVIFHGWVSDVPAWFQQIDIFVSNSYWEGQQNALIEAMASGCYCLAHFWDGVEEILPPQYLYVTERELEEKIIDYCCRPDAARWEHQAELRNIVEQKFSLEEMLGRMRDVITERR